MNLGEYINLHVFPTGRRIFAHTQVLERARSFGIKNLVEHVTGSIAHDREALQMELRRRASPQSRFSPEAGRLDAQLDRSVSGLDMFLDSQIRAYGEESEIGSAAAQVRAAIFPGGVKEVTHLPYVQEDEAVAAILERLRQRDLKALLARLPGTDAMIEQMRVRHEAYHAALRKEHEAPSADDIRAMQIEGQNRLCGTVVLILAHHVATNDRETTRSLLEPIERQAEDIRAARRRRRLPLDVNPDTGEEMDEADLQIPDTE